MKLFGEKFALPFPFALVFQVQGVAALMLEWQFSAPQKFPVPVAVFVAMVEAMRPLISFAQQGHLLVLVQ